MNTTDIKQGDIITFRAADNNFKALLCTSTFTENSPQYFTFAALSYDKNEKPNLQDILSNTFFGIITAKNDTFKYSTSQLEKMWSIHPEIKPFVIGSYGFIIWRKDLKKFQDNLDVIGNIRIMDNLDKNGNGSVNASDWTFLKNFFNNNLNIVLRDRGQKALRVDAIIKE